MAVTGINSEDRLVQSTFAEHLELMLGWDNVYAFNTETFGPNGTLGPKDITESVLTRAICARRWNLLKPILRQLNEPTASKCRCVYPAWPGGFCFRG